MRLSLKPEIQPDITHLSETSSEILRLVSDIPCHVSETLSIFFPLYPRMKPRDLHKSHDFQTLYAIFGFFRTSVHTLVIKFLDKDASTFKFFHAYGISFDSSMWISHFHSLISKFWPTSNFKLTSTDYSPQIKKFKENSKPINKNILCY